MQGFELGLLCKNNLGSVSEGLTKALEKVPISFHPSEERRLASAAAGRS